VLTLPLHQRQGEHLYGLLSAFATLAILSPGLPKVSHAGCLLFGSSAMFSHNGYLLSFNYSLSVIDQRFERIRSSEPLDLVQVYPYRCPITEHNELVSGQTFPGFPFSFPYLTVDHPVLSINFTTLSGIFAGEERLSDLARCVMTK